MNFFVVMCKSRKKFDKYIKINRIRNKYVVDIRKMLDEEGITPETAGKTKYFKILVLKRIQTAKEKKKDVYYIPYFDSPAFETDKALKLKELVGPKGMFNLLMFHDEFREDSTGSEFMNRLETFDSIQILEDY